MNDQLDGSHVVCVAGKPKMILHYGDLTDSTCLVHIISQVHPAEIYNLGAQSHVKVCITSSGLTTVVMVI